MKMKIKCYVCNGKGCVTMPYGKDVKTRMCKRCQGYGFVEMLKKDQKPMDDWDEDEEDKKLFGY